MNQRGFRDDAPPWSFFLPVTLAVVLGILIADAVRLAIGAIFVREAVQASAPDRSPTRTVVPSTETPAGTTEEPEVMGKLSAAKPAAPAGAPALPGPSSAMRDRGERACINGSVAERRPNGWEQALEDDAPVPCTADSP